MGKCPENIYQILKLQKKEIRIINYSGPNIPILVLNAQFHSLKIIEYYPFLNNIF